MGHLLLRQEEFMQDVEDKEWMARTPGGQTLGTGTRSPRRNPTGSKSERGLRGRARVTRPFPAWVAMPARLLLPWPLLGVQGVLGVGMPTLRPSVERRRG